MSRKIPLRPSLLRPLLLPRPSIPQNPPSLSRLLLTPPPANPIPQPSPLLRRLSSELIPFPRRHFASDSGPAENLVPIKTEEGFNAALSKANDEKLPSVFYFTAAWCGPCRILAPVVEEISKELSHVTTYKIDIDEEALQSALSNQKINAVPTIQFFQNGRKVSEMVGADPDRLMFTMRELYK